MRSLYFLIFTYFLGIDLTRGARYNFVYYPAIVVLLGASLAVCWHPPKEMMVKEEGKNGIKSIGKWGINGKKAVMLIWLMGFFSAVTVICNLGYQKYYRPDLFVQLIQQISPVPVLIATTHKSYIHTGEMMGVARELKLAEFAPKFFVSPCPSISRSEYFHHCSRKYLKDATTTF